MQCNRNEPFCLILYAAVNYWCYFPCFDSKTQVLNRHKFSLRSIAALAVVYKMCTSECSRRQYFKAKNQKKNF